MEGYKHEYLDENGNVIPHWDEAKNIQYNDTTNTGVETVQEALELIFANLPIIIGRGSIEQAKAKAATVNVVFCWLLEFTVTIDNVEHNIKKPIWHIPGTGVDEDYGYFIDALGTVIE